MRIADVARVHQCDVALPLTINTSFWGYFQACLVPSLCFGRGSCHETAEITSLMMADFGQSKQGVQCAGLTEITETMKITKTKEGSGCFRNTRSLTISPVLSVADETELEQLPTASAWLPQYRPSSKTSWRCC